jgi:hypothetical protein
LEDLIHEMFSAIPGVTLADRDVLAGHKDGELDLLFTNTAPEDGLGGFGRDLLVECKSSAKPLDSSGVNHFATQARRRRLPLSIIVALAGLTGNPERATAAQQSIRDAWADGSGILVLVEAELRMLRSHAHLVAVLERKRQKLVTRLHAAVLAQQEIAALNPDKGVSIRRGRSGIELAIKRVRDDAAAVLLECAASLPGGDLTVARHRAEEALESLAQEVSDHRDSPQEDPLWRAVHDRVVDVGAAFLALLDVPLQDPDSRRLVAFEIEHSGPRNLDAHAGSELWELLSAYHLRQVTNEDAYLRRMSAIAMAAIAVEEIIAINDIDPRDIFGDYDE